jgi:hypothetical protein
MSSIGRDGEARGLPESIAGPHAPVVDGRAVHVNVADAILVDHHVARPCPTDCQRTVSRDRKRLSPALRPVGRTPGGDHERIVVAIPSDPFAG